MMKDGLKDVFRTLFGVSFRDSYLFSLGQRAFLYHPRQEMLKTAMEFIAAHQIPGSYIEFGVYAGTTFQSAFHFAQRSGLHNMHFFALDSFEGLLKLPGLI